MIKSQLEFETSKALWYYENIRQDISKMTPLGPPLFGLNMEATVIQGVPAYLR